MADTFPLMPPIEPMLATAAAVRPTTPGLLYEPKWDGFRAIIYRGAEALCIESRELKPPPVRLTPMTRDVAVAADWLTRLERAGLDEGRERPSATCRRDLGLHHGAAS